MAVFYKHGVDIFFSTDLEVSSQHLNVVYVKTIQNTNEANFEVQTNFRYIKTLLSGKFSILGEKLLWFIKIQI